MKEYKKEKTAFIVLVFMIFVTSVVSLCVGKYRLSLGAILECISGKCTDVMVINVFTKLRFPRVLMAFLTGAGLGLAGSVYQTIFRNPLASPDIVGTTSGANLGAAIAIVLLGYSTVSVAGGAFLGAIVSVLCVLLFVRTASDRFTGSTSTYVLSGIIISAVAKAGIMALKYWADSDAQLAAIEFWTMGSLSSVTAAKVYGILPVWLVGFFGLVVLKRQIILLSLSDEESKSLGVRVGAVRMAVLAFSTLLVSSIISITGLISFAGLIAPHIANLISGKRNSVAMFLSSAVGAEMILLADLGSRSFGSAEIPLSILTTVVGVPVLLVFLCKRRNER